MALTGGGDADAPPDRRPPGPDFGGEAVALVGRGAVERGRVGRGVGNLGRLAVGAGAAVVVGPVEGSAVGSGEEPAEGLSVGGLLRTQRKQQLRDLRMFRLDRVGVAQ